MAAVVKVRRVSHARGVAAFARSTLSAGKQTHLLVPDAAGVSQRIQLGTTTVSCLSHARTALAAPRSQQRMSDRRARRADCRCRAASAHSAKSRAICSPSFRSATGVLVGSGWCDTHHMQSGVGLAAAKRAGGGARPACQEHAARCAPHAQRLPLVHRPGGVCLASTDAAIVTNGQI